MSKVTPVSKVTPIYGMKIFLLKMFSNIDNANLLIILSHEYIIV